MKVLVINGPNLNNLGSRDKSFYGSESYQDVIQNIEEYAEILQVEVTFFQGNSEGELISFIQKEVDEFDGIVINGGALTHYGLSLKDSLMDAATPLVEIHISNIHQREIYRRNSVVEPISIGQVAGFGTSGYLYALELLVNYLRNDIHT
ncbi:MAG TPA: 3-dehydroquinate dehydratase [Dehalococcoidia bacterium]|nr:3-dehydroquinate dehydratase [Chloroflexota bacterium]HCE75650.1 3-dehydroquinate dehydratase [Dehalococcoidia bacterium]|tara:strand:+ start:628 stop:1074 length:447 start_codon:yes stop_codon:yes gene_type:complete